VILMTGLLDVPTTGKSVVRDSLRILSLLHASQFSVCLAEILVVRSEILGAFGSFFYAMLVRIVRGTSSLGSHSVVLTCNVLIRTTGKRDCMMSENNSEKPLIHFNGDLRVFSKVR
jgi:hypothetical protein